MATFNVRFRNACNAYRSDKHATSLEDDLADLTRELLDPGMRSVVTTGSPLDGIQHRSYRIAVGSAEPEIWSPLRELWLLDSTSEHLCYEEQLYGRILALAKFTRNLVAGCPRNQEKALYVCSSNWWHTTI
jgi:hypothetical protein